MPELLARVDVRHVDLDDGNREDGKGVPNPVAVVGPCARVDEHSVHFLDERLVDPFTHHAFAVRLEAHNFDTELLRERPQLPVDLGKRDRSVLHGISFPEHV